jgi:DNA-binding YbaB/EbfC family protein
MFDKMKQFMEMKKQADAIKKELEATQLEVNDVRGIKVKINGAQYFQAIEIDDNFLKPENKKKLELELLRSLNSAVKKSQQAAAQKMKSVMPGLGM